VWIANLWSRFTTRLRRVGEMGGNGWFLAGNSGLGVDFWVLGVCFCIEMAKK
jgi:hypothetical protein